MFFLGFLIGLISGFIICLILLAVFYIITKAVLSRCGRYLKGVIDNETTKLSESLKNETEIIYPDNSKDIFKNKDSKIDDLLK